MEHINVYFGRSVPKRDYRMILMEQNQLVKKAGGTASKREEELAVAAKKLRLSSKMQRKLQKRTNLRSFLKPLKKQYVWKKKRNKKLRITKKRHWNKTKAMWQISIRQSLPVNCWAKSWMLQCQRQTDWSLSWWTRSSFHGQKSNWWWLRNIPSLCSIGLWKKENKI